MKAFFLGIKKTIGVILVIAVSLLMFLSILIPAIDKTLLNVDFVKRELAERNVYEGLAVEARAAAKEAYIQNTERFGFLDAVVDPFLEAVIRPEPIRMEFEDILDRVYNGETFELTGDYLVADYTETIVRALASLGLDAEYGDVYAVVRTVADAVLETIDITEYTNRITEVFVFAKSFAALTVIASWILTAVLLILLLVLFKDRLKWLSAPFFISGAISVFFGLIVFTVTKSDLIVLNESLTAFIFAIITGIAVGCVFYGIINIAVGAILRLIRSRRIRKAERQALR